MDFLNHPVSSPVSPDFQILSRYAPHYAHPSSEDAVCGSSPTSLFRLFHRHNGPHSTRPSSVDARGLQYIFHIHLSSGIFFFVGMLSLFSCSPTSNF
ncbi:hypothetical protein TNCT_283041 [Trichonephila clavata]|uniref:Uncharacterized protein n=1 Tax=Trichonephila clavata TaxID=2740835 RepID=A0A8X6FGK2_TRICU|nr:hypothetical protein TNCT_283041 [Trichonephila clavata]